MYCKKGDISFPQKAFTTRMCLDRINLTKSSHNLKITETKIYVTFTAHAPDIIQHNLWRFEFASSDLPTFATCVRDDDIACSSTEISPDCEKM